MIPQKNDLVEVYIDDISRDGEGIGHFEGYTLFIRDAVIGDRITAKVMKTNKNYGYARLMEILEPSKDRVEAPCQEARRCGGCQLMAMSYPAQLEFKKKLVKNSLERIGGFEGIEVRDIIGMDEPFRYRNKAQYPIGVVDGDIAHGFYAKHSHRIMRHEDCLLSRPINGEILKTVTDWMEEFEITPYDEVTGKGLVRHVLVRDGFNTGETLVCLVVNGNEVKHSEILAERLMVFPEVVGVCININKVRGNTILGKKNVRIAGRDFIYDTIGNVKYQISPLSFYQVNPEQTKKLYDTVRDFAGLTGNEIVWDLYCGIGTISLYLADGAKGIIGVEVIPQAVDDAKVNARLNNIKNASYYCGTAETVMPQILEELEAENSAEGSSEGMTEAGEHTEAEVSNDAGNEKECHVAIVDPPRKGCDKRLLGALLELEPDRIVYVSCDPATLARDLRVLTEEKYEIGAVQPVDMFPHTVHVETCVLLVKTSEA